MKIIIAMIVKYTKNTTQTRASAFAHIVVKHLTYKLKLTLNQLTQKHIKDMNIFANCQNRSKIDNGVIEIIEKEIKIERVNAKELKEEDIKRYKKKTS